MYWPIGTPRIYATTTSSQAPPRPTAVLSEDGIDSSTATADTGSLLSVDTALSRPDGAAGGSSQSDPASDAPAATTPLSPPPYTPKTPAVNSVDHYFQNDSSGLNSDGSAVPFPSGEPIVALRLSRTGHLFAVITETTMTIWQTKVSLLARACGLLS